MMRSFSYIILFGFSFLFTVVFSSLKLKRVDRGLDVFGPTKYGFRCGTITHKKAELYTAALNGCKVWTKNRKIITCGTSLCQSPADKARDVSFSEANFRYSFALSKGPYLLHPILRGLDVFEEGSNLPPGPDRVVMNRNCEIKSVLTNGAVRNGPPIISECQSLTSSLTPSSSPARAPASIPNQPGLSPGRINRVPTLADGVGRLN